MSPTAETIWEVPVYLPYVQPPLTDALVRKAERKIGFKLPAEYLALLKVQNGGYIRYGLPKSLHRVICGIGPHFPSITEVDWDEVQEYVSIKLDGLIPFDGDGHWHLCLDYRKNAEAPSITHVDVENESESKVAKSFAEYLRLLRPNADPDEFAILNVPDVNELVTRFARAVRVQFEPPSSYDHGYPVYRAGAGTARKPEWVWISPNLVPRGFVREDDERYKELRGLMPGHGKRYPGLPETSYVLSATDGIRERVVKALKESSIEVRRLKEFV